MTARAGKFQQTFFHGTKADLVCGDAIVVGHASNMGQLGKLSWVYFTATLDAAIWGAELSQGDGEPRIYLVQPTGPIEDDPNLTDKKFPGNPTMSYRSRDELTIIGEVVGWQGHAPEALQAMREGLAKMVAEGRDEVID